MSNLFLKLSRIFFDIALFFDKEKRKPIPFSALAPLQVCSIGIFIQTVEKNGVLLGMFANSSIGFFFRDKIFDDEIYHSFATAQDIEGVKKYIVDKIIQGHEQLEVLENEIQRDLQSK